MKVIAQFANRVQAEMWVAPLKEYDIPYLIQGDDCGGMRPELTIGSDLKVLVAKHDLDRVKEIYPEID